MKQNIPKLLSLIPAFLAVASLTIPAHGGLLTYEGFGYADADTLTGLNGGSGWRNDPGPQFAWGTSGTSGTVASPGLSYADVGYTTAPATSGLALTANNNNRLLPIDAGSAYDSASFDIRDGGNRFGAATADAAGAINGVSLYGSFLVKSSNWSAARLLFELNDNGGGSQLRIMQSSVGSNLDIRDGSSNDLSGNSAELNGSNTYLVVWKLDFSSTEGGDNFTFWLNPTGGTNAPAGGISLTTPKNITFNNLLIRGLAGAVVFDEVRLGTSWADVAPAVGAPVSVPVLLTYEGFAYTDGATLTGLNGGSGWRPSAGTWATSGTSGTAVTPGLSYTDAGYASGEVTNLPTAGLALTANNNLRFLPIDAGSAYDSATFDIRDGGNRFGAANAGAAGAINGVSLYGSFLVKSSDWSAARLFFELNDNGGGSQLRIIQNSAGSTLDIRDGGSNDLSDNSAELSGSNTYLVVWKLDFSSTEGGDNFTFWLNPSASSVPPSGEIALTATRNITFNNLFVRGLAGNVVFDEIRMGKAWTDVAPKSSTTATPYQSWAAGFSNFTDTVAGNDPDNDGLKNLLEFVLGGNPTINDTPSIRPSVAASGSDLVMTFKRSDASELQPVAVKVQVSSDLVTWNPADDITIGAIGGSGPNSATYTVANNAGMDTIVVTIPKAAAAKKFARVVATE